MTIQFRTPNPQIIVTNNTTTKTLIIHDVQIRITNEDYDQFLRLFYALDVKTKTEALWYIIHKGMDDLERIMIKNKKIVEEEIEVK